MTGSGKLNADTSAWRALGRRSVVGGMALLVGAMALGSCGMVFGNSIRLRYRIEVTMHTPDGLKTASAVQEIKWRQPLTSMEPVDRGDIELIGDALAVPIGEGHIFITLISSQNIVDAAIRAGIVTPADAKVRGNILEKYRAFKRFRGKATIDGATLRNRAGVSLWFVRFANEQKPATYETGKLDGSTPSLDIVSASVTTTDAEITRQVEPILPWITAAPADAIPNSASALLLLSDRARIIK